MHPSASASASSAIVACEPQATVASERRIPLVATADAARDAAAIAPRSDAATPERVDAAIAPDHFESTTCHNCGAVRTTPYCGACGQQRATRLGVRAVGQEAWQVWRLFELDVLQSAWRLARRPGDVAREYVLGARKRHVHPLKLLLFAIGVLLLVLSRSNALDSAGVAASYVADLVRGASNWSFSFGIPAIWLATWIALRRRAGFNATEHLVLAVYAQFLVICASVLSKLPTLVWRDPGFLASHKAASSWLMFAVGIGVLWLAARQFFRLDLRRDAWRLLLAAAIYVGAKWLLLRGYVWLVISVALGRPA